MQQNFLIHFTRSMIIWLYAKKRIICGILSVLTLTLSVEIYFQSINQSIGKPIVAQLLLGKVRNEKRKRKQTKRRLWKANSLQFCRCYKYYKDTRNKFWRDSYEITKKHSSSLGLYNLTYAPIYIAVATVPSVL